MNIHLKNLTKLLVITMFSYKTTLFLVTYITLTANDSFYFSNKLLNSFRIILVLYKG